MDLLLIAGDLFHRQPLLRELKEVDYLFSKLHRTRVVLIAGNHDYLKVDSYYRTYQWKSKVYFLGSETMSCVEFPDIETCVYGLSYGKKEITDPLYEDAAAEGRQPIEILLAHGGDEKHIPFRKSRMQTLGYDYIALGHIHRKMELEKNRMNYAGSLEPTDKNDTGKHGYVLGEISGGKVKTTFVPFAKREYIHTSVVMNEQMTAIELKEKLGEIIRQQGIQNIYKVTFSGFRSEDFVFQTEGMDAYGNVLEFVDDTKVAFDFDKIQKMNAGNLLGKYIERLKHCEKDSVEYDALFEGVSALMHSSIRG